MSRRSPPSIALILSLILAAGCTVGYATPPPAGPPPPPPAPGRPDMTGWRFMGDAWVTGRVDRDYIRVGKQEGRFARVMLIVTESDLEMFNMVIQFGNGNAGRPASATFSARDRAAARSIFPGTFASSRTSS